MTEGWSFPTFEARKAHYFDVTKRSLCLRYSGLGLGASKLEADIKPSPDDCPVCRVRLDNRKKAAAHHD